MSFLHLRGFLACLLASLLLPGLAFAKPDTRPAPLPAAQVPVKGKPKARPLRLKKPAAVRFVRKVVPQKKQKPATAAKPAKPAKVAKKKALVKKVALGFVPFAHAVLLNGGSSPASNYYSHVLYLRMMRAALQKQGLADRDITIFASDGNSSKADQAIRTGPSVDKVGWLFAHRRAYRMFQRKPDLINTRLKNKKLLVAKNKVFASNVKKLASNLRSKKPLLFFVTDHGTRNRREKNNQQISMWHEDLSVRDYHKALRPLGQRRVISVMSQCYSGGFVWSVFRKPGRFGVPQGNRCGFYATLPSRPAYGCFPQTKLQKEIGHAYRFIRAMGQSKTLNDAHERVLMSDVTPDIPARSSDLYLRELLQGDARADKANANKLVDSILQKYSSKGYKGMEADLRLMSEIARRFGVARPMTMAALLIQIKNLKKKYRWYRQASRMWRSAFVSARDAHLNALFRNDRSLYRQYLHTFPNRRRRRYRRRRYRGRRNRRRRRVRFNAWTRKKLKAQLQTKFLHYVEARPGLKKRLHTLYKKKRQMSAAAFQLQVQKAAFERMQLLFFRVAGRLLLANSRELELRAHRQGLQRLLTCERTPLSKPKQQALTLPPVNYVSKHKLPMPSWFGISFRRVNRRVFPSATSGAVVVENVYLNTPAHKAGIKQGDVILTMNGHILRERYEIRERVMTSPAGVKVPYRMLRNGKLMKRTIVFQKLLEPPSLKMRPVIGSRLNTLLSAKSLNPKMVLPSLKKDTTLLFFWATWCGPCKAALPALRHLQRAYGRLGLKVVTVSNESSGVIHRWLKKKKPGFLPFVNVSDSKRSLSRFLRVRATPTFVILKEGRVVYSHVGYTKMKKFEAKLARFVRQK